MAGELTLWTILFLFILVLSLDINKTRKKNQILEKELIRHLRNIDNYISLGEEEKSLLQRKWDAEDKEQQRHE